MARMLKPSTRHKWCKMMQTYFIFFRRSSKAAQTFASTKFHRPLLFLQPLDPHQVQRCTGAIWLPGSWPSIGGSGSSRSRWWHARDLLQVSMNLPLQPWSHLVTTFQRTCCRTIHRNGQDRNACWLWKSPGIWESEWKFVNLLSSSPNSFEA